MSVALGHKGNAGHPEVQEMLLRILDTCKNAGVPCAVGCTAEEVPHALGAGVQHPDHRAHPDRRRLGGGTADRRTLTPGNRHGSKEWGGFLTRPSRVSSFAGIVIASEARQSR